MACMQHSSLMQFQALYLTDDCMLDHLLWCRRKMNAMTWNSSTQVGYFVSTGIPATRTNWRHHVKTSTSGIGLAHAHSHSAAYPQAESSVNFSDLDCAPW